MPLHDLSALTMDDLLEDQTLADTNTDRSSLPTLPDQVFEVIDCDQFGYLSNIEANSYKIQRYEEILNDPTDTETLFARIPTHVIACAWTNSIPDAIQDEPLRSIKSPTIDYDPIVISTEKEINETENPFSQDELFLTELIHPEEENIFTLGDSPRPLVEGSESPNEPIGSIDLQSRLNDWKLATRIFRDRLVQSGHSPAELKPEDRPHFVYLDLQQEAD